MSRIIVLALFLVSCATKPIESTLGFEGYPRFIQGVDLPLMVRMDSTTELQSNEMKEIKKSFTKKVINDMEWVQSGNQLTPGRVYVDIVFLDHVAQFDRPFWSGRTKVKATIIDHRNEKKINKNFKVFEGHSKVFGLQDEISKKKALYSSWKTISEDLVLYLNNKINSNSKTR